MNQNKMFLFILLFLTLPWIGIDQHLALAERTYTPAPGSPERKAILDALRERLRGDPAPDRPEFQYERIPEDIRILFQVGNLKVKDPWAWIEAQGKNYNVDLFALLMKKDGRWAVKGMVNPRVFPCPDSGECIGINQSIYKKFKELFPAVPKEIFPEEHPESRGILQALRGCIKTLPPESVVFIVRFLKVKDGWAWVETDPRGLEAGNFEPIDALLRKEGGKWQVKNFRPCCGDCEDDPYCAKGMYHKKLLKMFPTAPKEIFPERTR